MRRFLCFLLVVLMFTGCDKKNDSFENAMLLRDKLLKCSSCTFDAKITADYEDRIYTFDMNCRMDQNGSVAFSVSAPETIKGITGTLSESGGGLTFDDQILAFQMLAEGMITPVGAPYHMVEALRSGYMQASCEYEDGIFLQINDSYMDDQLKADIWLKDGTTPEVCELYWEGRRFLTVQVSNFEIL